MALNIDRLDERATADLQRAFTDRNHLLATHTLEEAARVLNYGGSLNDAETLATFTEARASHPAYAIEYRYAAIQAFRLRIQELLGVERDL